MSPLSLSALTHPPPLFQNLQFFDCFTMSQDDETTTMTSVYCFHSCKQPQSRIINEVDFATGLDWWEDSELSIQEC